MKALIILAIGILFISSATTLNTEVYGKPSTADFSPLASFFLWRRIVMVRSLSPDLIEKTKGEKALPKVLSPSQLSATLCQIGNLKHKSKVLLAYSSGIRIGELLSLRLEDVGYERKMLHIRGAKGRKDRYTILSRSVLALLQKYMKEHRPKEFVYEGQYGGKYSASSVQKNLEAGAEIRRN